MKINHMKYGRPVGTKMHCIQCGKMVTNKDGNIKRAFIFASFLWPSDKNLPMRPQRQLPICRVCLLRKGGLRTNLIGSVQLYDMYYGKPFTIDGGIPMDSDITDPWK
jgi:hypothetical protein